MSPILSLPTELFVAIGVVGQEDCLSDPAFKSHSLEWILSHTSSRLRAAIIGAPTLWTRVEADLTDESSVEIAKLYLERSRAREIWANLYHDWDGGDSDALHALMAVRFHHFIPHINRMWRLRIATKTISMEWAKELLAATGTIAAPKLQHLELVNNIEDDQHNYNYYSPAGVAPTADLLWLDAPRLDFLKMVAFNPLIGSKMANVKHLELWCIEGVGNLFTTISARCLSLVYLYLDMRNELLPDPSMRRCLRIPSLKSLHMMLPYDTEDDEWFLLRIIDFFETPALSELMIESVHDDIYPLFNKTSLAHASFPALASLSLINREPCAVGCDNITTPPYTISAPPLALFPALSSLTLVNHCYTENLVTDILGPDSGPWTLPQTITLCPREATLDAVSDALQIAVGSQHQRGQALPKFRLSSALASLENWGEIGADVETYDPTDLLEAFNLP
ncbi:hypothetical protein B0H14DRAFT_2753133 [Mycena olivaceomarginata]|nr:hypothetical protein B0H14DRAFT_2753133 [Mycena olivaceomarginata]